jgi:phosphatidylglycerol:prolipoprotein diacylglycerol transferase
MLAVAFLAGIFLARHRAKSRQIEPQSISDLSLIILVAGVAGARLQYALFHFKEFATNPFRVFAVWEGGLTFYGGVILALIAGIVYIRRKHLSFSKVGDIIAPSLALGVSLTRMGCFLNSCCFGKATSSSLGISFPQGSFPWEIYPNAAVHPAQLYEATAGLVILVLLFSAQRRTLFSGSLFWLFLALYSAWRFSVDFLRYYEPYKYLFGGPIVVNQLVSLLLLALGVTMIAVRGTRKK